MFRNSSRNGPRLGIRAVQHGDFAPMRETLERGLGQGSALSAEAHHGFYRRVSARINDLAAVNLNDVCR